MNSPDNGIRALESQRLVQRRFLHRLRPPDVGGLLFQIERVHHNVGTHPDDQWRVLVDIPGAELVYLERSLQALPTRRALPGRAARRCAGTACPRPP